MAAIITSVTPGRGRDGDTGIDINGTGFSGTPGQNTVTVDGQAATVTADTTTKVTFTVPSGITLNRHVLVQITNDDDATTDSRFWWSKDSVANLRTKSIPGQIPGPFENLASEAADIAEAKDYEELATFAEFIRDFGAKPAVASWSANTETLSTDKTLLDIDATLQFLDPNGADRIIILPSPTTISPFFIIRNTGRTAAGADLLVETATGAPIIRVADGGVAWMVTNGVEWVEAFTPAEENGFLIFGWGGAATVAGNFHRAWGNPGNSTLASASERTNITTPSPGRLLRLGINTTFADATTDFRIHKNGAISETLDAPGAVGTIAATTIFAAGDELALEFDSGTAPDISSYAALAEFSGGQAFGYQFAWGATLSSLGRFAVSWGFPTAAQQTVLDEDTEITVFGGTARGVAFNKNNSGTATMALRKNGAVAETFTATGTEGTAKLATVLAAGDQLGIEFDAGTAPGNSNWLLSVVHDRGVVLAWGATLLVATDFGLCWGVAADTPTGAPIGPSEEFTSTTAGTYDDFSWNTGSADATTVMNIFKNGASAANVALTGPTGTVTGIALSVAEGDEIATRYGSGTAPGKGTYAGKIK